MKKYYFENPDKPTFSAIKFNDQIFARGRGLFVHLMKYFPTVAKEAENSSISLVPWTPENFSKATHLHLSHFKGIRFEYVDIDKEFRPAIKALSNMGEGWWPSRADLKVPGVDYEMNLHNFMMNFEHPPSWVRRLGRGVNITLDKRYELMEGVDFNRRGYNIMRRAYQKLMGPKFMFSTNLPILDTAYYHVRKFAYANDGFRSIEPVEWRVWTIVGAQRREDYLNGLKRKQVLE